MTLPLFLLRGALDKAEQATERLATISKDVMKALEHANPKESKKYVQHVLVQNKLWHKLSMIIFFMVKIQCQTG